MPVTRKSGALKRPCASSIAIPATAAIRVPAPNSTMRNPSWLTVPKASNRLRSYCAIARQPPTAIVARPSTTTGTHHTGASANPGESRATRYTPALTIEAACRYALTGVGAAIAAGSQGWKGSCADFVSAPTRISASAAVTVPPPSAPA